MTHYRILGACFICLSITACNTQEASSPVKKASEIKTALLKPAKQEAATIVAAPALKLSINDIPGNQIMNDGINLHKDKQLAEENNALFQKLSKNHMEPGINLTGKLLTDENKFENNGYLDSVNGVQISIKGSFN